MSKWGLIGLAWGDVMASLAVAKHKGIQNIIYIGPYPEIATFIENQDFISKVGENFIINEISEAIVKPSKLHDLSMYVNGKWVGLTAKEGTFNDNDPIGSLDVSVLSKYILDPVLNIKDLRTDTRIDFVGGIRGLEELEKRVQIRSQL